MGARKRASRPKIECAVCVSVSTLEDTMKCDAYHDALALQNAGEPCPHCGSTSGHFVTCALLNRAQAEDASAEAQNIDNFFLASLRIEAL